MAGEALKEQFPQKGVVGVGASGITQELLQVTQELGGGTVAQFFRCEQLAEAALFGGSCPFNELGAQNVVGCVSRRLE